MKTILRLGIVGITLFTACCTKEIAEVPEKVKVKRPEVPDRIVNETPILIPKR